MAELSTNLANDNAIPYFLWDEPMTVGELKRRLSAASADERNRLLAKILREARDTDVWRFVSPAEVRAKWTDLEQMLGRRRGFWQFLLDRWRVEGLIG